MSCQHPSRARRFWFSAWLVLIRVTHAECGICGHTWKEVECA